MPPEQIDKGVIRISNAQIYKHRIISKIVCLLTGLNKHPKIIGWQKPEHVGPVR